MADGCEKKVRRASRAQHHITTLDASQGARRWAKSFSVDKKGERPKKSKDSQSHASWRFGMGASRRGKLRVSEVLVVSRKRQDGSKVAATCLGVADGRDWVRGGKQELQEA